jgi:NADH dehydrogenase
VLIQWAWSYLTFERGARLITGDQTLPGWTELQREEHSPEKKTKDKETKIMA